MANPEFLRAHTLAEYDINTFWGIVTKCLVVVLNVERNIINIKYILLIIVTSYKFMNHRKSQQITFKVTKDYSLSVEKKII